ncbi:sigma-70 family RNA polymerase sigma factor [candidate division TA06 bacterium]|nr:sigma-70 family RNA polymerase sigma factor [candidate division TA06 bacterium]
MEPIRQYLKEIKDIPLLTPEEEIRLSKLVRRGDAKARKEMIQANLRLVINIAKRYTHLGLPMMDLIEEGNMGLMKAVEKFDPRKGYRFSTYGAWWVKQYITRAIANQAKTIRVPVYMVETLSRLKKKQEALTQKLGRKPRTNELAKAMKLPMKKIKEITEQISQTTSLDAPVGEGETGQFIDLIEDEASLSPVDEFSKVMRQERVKDLLEKMSEREQEILSLRFGLQDGITHTLSDTAKRFGITRERVRQIENAAMRKLRSYLVAQDVILKGLE